MDGIIASVFCAGGANAHMPCVSRRYVSYNKHTPLAKMSFDKILHLRPIYVCQWKRKVPNKSLNNKDTRQIFLKVQLAMDTFDQAESSILLKNPENSKSGADVGPRSAWEKLMQMFGSKRRDSESSTDIDRPNQLLRHEFWTECAR